MKVTLEVDVEAAGLLLVDAGTRLPLEGEWLDLLNLVLDPDGETDLPLDNPGRPWPEVWGEAVAALREHAARDHFVPVLCDEGRLTLRLQRQPLSREDTARRVALFEEPVEVTGDGLLVVNPMEYFVGLEDPLAKPLAQVPLSAGHCLMRIHQLSPVGEQTEGHFGTAEHPAVIVEVAEATSPAPVPSGPFPRLQLRGDGIRRPGMLCEATVTRIEDGRASMRLHLTSQITAGFGRMPLPSNTDLAPGQRIRVRLVEDRRNYWLVEWNP